MKIFYFSLLLFVSVANAAEERLALRVSGLFQPDRKDDLLRQAGTLEFKNGEEKSEIKLVEVDYENATATFVYDSEAKVFKNVKPEEMRNRIDNLLRGATNGCFTVLPPSTLPREKWREEKIEVGGIDCKACSFGVYLCVYNLPGVQQAQASFKSGLVMAWIDPDKTNRANLIEALRKRDIKVKDP
jgi:copper chaperone CopZ